MSIVQYIQYIQFPSGPSAKPSVCWPDISQIPNLCTLAFYEIETFAFESYYEDKCYINFS